MARSNENCLDGMVCHVCKSNGPFRIVTLCWAEVHDDGISETQEHEWDDKSCCVCVDCKFTGKVKDFRARSEKKKGKKR